MKNLKSLFRALTVAAIFLFATAQADAQPQKKERQRQKMERRGRNSINITNPKFFKSEEAVRIGAQILAYQRVTGGWPKNIDMAKPLSDEEMAKVLNQKERRDDSTIDNNATTMQMRYLAHLYKATNDEKYRDAFLRGLQFILSGQYENGGWPQFWPDPQDYQVHITYNDGAIGNVLEMFQQMIDGKAPYDGKLLDNDAKKQLTTAFDKGIDIILKTQIVVNGEPTVWCQQHDRETLKPAHARAYELPSFCSQESAQLLRLLMSLPNPDERTKRAIRGAMKWFDTYKITGYRYVREGFRGQDSGKPTRLEADPTAPPLWARFYDLERCEPFVCDRDGVPRRHLHEIGRERRNSYAWYSDRPRELYPLYEAWAEKYDPGKTF